MLQYNFSTRTPEGEALEPKFLPQQMSERGDLNPLLWQLHSG